jgi:hypothetical protein
MGNLRVHGYFAEARMVRHHERTGSNVLNPMGLLPKAGKVAKEER